MVVVGHRIQGPVSHEVHGIMPSRACSRPGDVVFVPQFLQKEWGNGRSAL